MTDTPKFTVVDRRKFREGEDPAPAEAKTSEALPVAAPAAEEPKPAPRLTLVEPSSAHKVPESASVVESGGPVAVADAAPFDQYADMSEAGLDESGLDEAGLDEAGLGEAGPDRSGFDDSGLDDADALTNAAAPSIEEFRFQKVAYDQAAERLDDLLRAQNPGAPPQEKIGFEHLVQQLYLSAMMQMGAGTPEGQRPRIDILGARQTIELLHVVLEKTKGNISEREEKTFQTVLFEVRGTFLELTRMISTQPPMPPPPGSKPGSKR